MTLMTVAFAQPYEIVRAGDENLTLRVERGFTPWDFWVANADRNTCGWSDFRPAVNALNPSHVASEFRAIAIDSEFRVPQACASGIVNVAPAETDLALLAESIDRFSAALANAASRNTVSSVEFEEIEQRVKGVEERIAELENNDERLSGQVDELSAFVDARFANLARERDTGVFWQWPYRWWVRVLIFFVILAIVVALLYYIERIRNERNRQKGNPPDPKSRITKMQDEIARLRDKNQELRDEAVAYKGARDKLREEVALLRNTIERHNEESNKIREERDREVEALREEVDRLSRQAKAYPEGHVERVTVQNKTTGGEKAMLLKHEPPYVTVFDTDGNHISGPMHRKTAIKRAEESEEESAHARGEVVESEKTSEGSSKKGNPSKTRRGGRHAHRRRQNRNKKDKVTS
ncbi:MAG: hypothetical protein U5L75_01885 [Candidatus Campbellbacteria bacterium]|nr:hypothetical protein [Candidatus Campbellbacteria bacterium]